jgi:hypothetical protein
MKIGYKVSGLAYIHRGEISGWIPMNTYIVSSEQLTKDFLLMCVNSGGLSCQSISKAILDIENLYSNGNTSFNRKITIKGTPERQKFFKINY